MINPEKLQHAFDTLKALKTYTEQQCGLDTSPPVTHNDEKIDGFMACVVTESGVLLSGCRVSNHDMINVMAAITDSLADRTSRKDIGVFLLALAAKYMTDDNDDSSQTKGETHVET